MTIWMDLSDWRRPVYLPDQNFMIVSVKPMLVTASSSTCRRSGLQWACEHCGGFLETYLLCDFLLLADVLSIFRKTMLDSFSLDPMQYFSLNGYSFDCALSTCLQMHQMIENSVSRGLATIGSPRYAKANNFNVPKEEYAPVSPTSLIHFFDVISIFYDIPDFPHLNNSALIFYLMRIGRMLL